jgi:RNA polymerase sigma-70 factor (ECF subfamily)
MSIPQVTAAVAPLSPLADLMDVRPAAGREKPHVQALIDAARGGDQGAFGDLVVLHERVVYRTALAALGSREDAEDAAQEAFVVAWQKLSGFRGDAAFRTWLLTIVWRKALDRRRVRRLWWSRTRTTDATDSGPGLDSVATSDPTPEAHTLSRDLERRIHARIAQLSPKLKDTFVLASSGEHSYEEIAAVLGIPVGTVKWRVSEARRLIGRDLV